MLGFSRQYSSTRVTELPFEFTSWMCRQPGLFVGRPETLRQLLVWRVVRPVAPAGLPLTPIAAAAARWSDQEAAAAAEAALAAAAEDAAKTYVTGYEPVWRPQPATEAELCEARAAEHEFGTRYFGCRLSCLPHSYLEWMCAGHVQFWDLSQPSKRLLLRRLEVLGRLRYDTETGRVEVAH